MENFNLYENTENELISDQSKAEIIQRVFENRAKSLLADKVENVFTEGGGVFEKKIYTPYEFLYELLPIVYGRPYVISDQEARIKTAEIEERTRAINEREKQILTISLAQTIYDANVSEADRSEIEIEKRKIKSDKIFISELELEAYLYANPYLNREDYTKNAQPNVNILVQAGYLIEERKKRDDNTIERTYVYLYDYISGDVYEKRKKLAQNKDILIENNLFTGEEIDYRISLLDKHKNKPIQITDNIENSLVISPYSKFAKSYILRNSDFTDDWMKNDEGSLTDVFKNWVENEMDSKLLNDSPSRASINTYFISYATLGSNPTEREKSNYSDLREKSFRNGKIMMFNFLNSLTETARLNLVLSWNERFNFFTEPQYHKYPINCSLNNIFKNGTEFIPNESQVEAMQFIETTGSGLIAYGVGVGKTASAIMTLSHLLGSNKVNKPILVLPNAVYDKWKLEMFGGDETTYLVTYLDNNFETETSFDTYKKAKKFAKEVGGNILKKTIKSYGHIPQWNKYVELYNLSEEYVKTIKNYSVEDIDKMQRAEFLKDYLKEMPDNYDFENEDINILISVKYDGWNPYDFNRDYMFYVNSQRRKYKEKNNIDADDDLTIEQENDFLSTIKETKKSFFTKEFKIYKEELPYVLGAIKNFDDKTIFLATYEGIKHLGLSESKNRGQRYDRTSKFGKIYTEISQNGKFNSADFDAKSNLDAKFKKAIFGVKNTIIDLSEFEFDGAIFDESHFIKNNYTDTLGDYKMIKAKDRYGYETYVESDKTRVRRYNVGNKKYTNLALSGYFLSRYINIDTNDRNVIQLTATPFTNSPNEIYGMLALTNYGFLSKFDFNNMTDFYDIFMDVSYDLVFSPSGVERKEQLVGFLNLPALRNMIYAIMNYKSGEDANIKRPKKYLLPNSPIDERSILPETSEQDILFKKVKDYIRGNIDYTELCQDNQDVIDIDEISEEDLLAIINERGTEEQQEDFNSLEFPLEEEEDFFRLKKAVQKILEKKQETVDENDLTESDKSKLRVQIGLNILKQITLSPYLSVCAKESGFEPTPQQYVESSPKINYAVQCIKSIHDYEKANDKPLSGCIIYMNIGINVKNTRLNFSWSETGLEKIKSYLVNILGYSYDDISIVSGKTNRINREKEKNRFLKGRSIIMLGSSAISTGVDLQNNSSTLFLCDFDWNPTTNEQVAGRIHRQGNRFANVRIVYPMIRNSFDPPVFQKLYEKTLRIKTLWDKNNTGAVLDTKEFDLGELRKRILDEPEDLARFDIEEKTIQLTSDINLRNNRIDELRQAKKYQNILKEDENIVRGILVVISAYYDYKKHNIKIKNIDQEINDLLDEQLKEKVDSEKQKIGRKITEKRNRKNELTNEKPFEEIQYSELGTSSDKIDLINKINDIVLSSNSKFNSLTDDDMYEIQYNFVEDYFSRFDNGKYNMSIPQEEDITRYVNYRWKSDVVKTLIDYKDAVKKYNKIKETLEILGIDIQDVDMAVEELKNQVNAFTTEKENVTNSFDSLIEKYSRKKLERLYTQISLEEKVSEFSEMNYLLDAQLRPFVQDEASTIVSPRQFLDIRPNVDDAEIIEEEIVKKQVKKSTTKPKTPRIIGRLKKGLIVRTRTEKDGMFYENDLFYDSDTNEYIKFTLILDADNNEVDEMEDVITEADAIAFYESMQEFITNEFYEKDTTEEDIEEITEVGGEDDEKAFILENIAGLEIILEITEEEEERQSIIENINGLKILLEL